MKFKATAAAFMGSRIRKGDVFEADENFKASWCVPYVEGEPEEVIEVKADREAKSKDDPPKEPADTEVGKKKSRRR